MRDSPRFAGSLNRFKLSPLCARVHRSSDGAPRRLAACRVLNDGTFVAPENSGQPGPLAAALVDTGRPAANADRGIKPLVTPRVSVGMPVYNGERFLRQAVESILGQTFRDFELIISDNGSTDATQQLCEEFAAADSRVRYIRHDKNRGAIFNWAHVVDAARAPYFKWASANDISAPRLLELCVQCLDTQPAVVVAYGPTENI